MSLSDNLYHKRLPDFEAYDKVTIEIEPRYKTSGMSGDEWRQSAVVTLWFKGVPVVQKALGSMDAALARLAAIRDDASCPIDDKVIKRERGTCDQPSCENNAVSKFRLKKLFSDRGERLDPSDNSLTYYRQFCKKHLRRGDCSREDCDDNYDVISGPGPDDASGFEGDVSPAVFGGVVMVSDSGPDDVPLDPVDSDAPRSPS